MSIYVEGNCRECGNRIAAAVKHDEESWRNDIAEFVEDGYRVALIDTDGRVEIEGHAPTCYHELSKVKEIRPEKAGELWKSNDGRTCMIIEPQYQLKRCWSPDGFTDCYDEKMIHNKNGWTRLYPPVEDKQTHAAKWEKGWQRDDVVHCPNCCFVFSSQNKS